MGKKIYVGNLPFTTTSESLSEVFAPFGTVGSSKIITDRETGRSKGFGFVEMADASAADAAIAQLHGSDLGGRSLTVNEARPMERREGGFSGNRPAARDSRQSNERW